MAVQERTEHVVSLTPAAATKIRDLMAQESDVEFEQEGVKIVVDPFSAPYLSGATVDYLETIQESGFKIDNPNAVSSCGCGHSFQVDESTDPGATVGGCGSVCSA